jgi:hypothetical protein
MTFRTLEVEAAQRTGVLFLFAAHDMPARWKVRFIAQPMPKA